MTFVLIVQCSTVLATGTVMEVDLKTMGVIKYNSGISVFISCRCWH